MVSAGTSDDCPRTAFYLGEAIMQSSFLENAENCDELASRHTAPNGQDLNVLPRAGEPSRKARIGLTAASRRSAAGRRPVAAPELDLQQRDIPLFFRSRRRPLSRHPAAATDQPRLTMAFQRKKTAAIVVKVPFPGIIEPAPASSIDKVPSGDDRGSSSMATGSSFISSTRLRRCSLGAVTTFLPAAR
jgi:hypothetical protein